MASRESAPPPSPQTLLSRLSPSDNCPWRRIRVGIISSSCVQRQCKTKTIQNECKFIYQRGNKKVAYKLSRQDASDSHLISLPLPHWYIRHGARDRDTAFSVSINLAAKLQNSGKDVNFKLPWNRPHSGDILHPYVTYLPFFIASCILSKQIRHQQTFSILILQKSQK